MRRHHSDYSWYLVETYSQQGEPSASKVRARPLAGQGLPTTMKVECSRRMRHSHAVGTVFRVKAQVIENSNGTRFLYTHFDWPYEAVPRPTARSA